MALVPGLKYHCRCAEAYSGGKPPAEDGKGEVLKELEELGERLVEEIDGWGKKYNREGVEKVEREIWTRYEAPQ